VFGVAQPQIHVLLDEPVVPPEIAAALRRIDAGVRLSRLENELHHPSNTPADARLVITSARQNGNGEWLKPLCQCWDRNPCATLVLTPSPGEESDIPAAHGVLPIGFASGLSADELAGRLTTMCAFRESFSNLRHEIAELRKKDSGGAVTASATTTANYLDEQLRLASQIQRDLLPDPLPRISGALLHKLYRPADCVSGDIYDVVRLDAGHVALSVADATGHGIPAALLTMLIKRGMRAGETQGGVSGVARPDEVLGELNREIIDANLTHCQFVTGFYGVYAEQERRLCWARAGSPLPILVRPGLGPQQLQSRGMLLGVDEEAEFELAELTLEPGDVVIFHTDGLDALLLERTHEAPFDDINETPWYASLGERPAADHLAQISERAANTSPADWPVDDLTVLALEIL
jgi:hypothetical protein